MTLLACNVRFAQSKILGINLFYNIGKLQLRYCLSIYSSSIWVRTKPRLWRYYRKSRDRPWPEMTLVTWPEVCSAHAQIHHPYLSPAFFFGFPHFFLTIVVVQVVQVPWLPEVTKGHVNPSGFPSVCAFATGSCAISALVGPFDRKWRYETSPRSDRRSPEGVEWVCACATGSCAISALMGSFHR